MKIFKYSIFLFVGVLFLIVACENRLDKEWQDPEQHSPKPEEIIPGMFTQMIDSRFYKLDYGEWWWSWNGGFGIPGYAQIAVRRPHPSDASGFSEWDNYTGTGDWDVNVRPVLRFGWYYTDLKNWGLIRDEIESLSGQTKSDVELFFLCATIIKDVVGLQQVDVFDKIPYLEAFQGTKGVFYPKYDNVEDIYDDVLDELAELTTKLPEAYNAMSDKAKQSFALQDIALGGDIRKWVQYINAIRLRHGVRISGVNPEFAKKHIQSAITNLPTTDFIWPATDKNGNTIQAEGGGLYARALYEQAYALVIPNIIMQRMNYGDVTYDETGEDDPRLPVIAQPTRYYEATKNDPLTFVGTTQNYDAAYPYWPTSTLNPNPTSDMLGFDNGPGLTFRLMATRPRPIETWSRNQYSTYNASTFIYGNIPQYFNSLAENDLFLAEIELKNLASTGKSPSEHIRDAVIHSTDFWYQVNGYSPFTTDLFPNEDYKRVFDPVKPSDAVINRFADKIKAEYEAAPATEDDKMEIIMQQKYVHFNLLGIYELYAELRRTRHPKLEKIVVNGITYGVPLERMRYPNDEQQNNSESYKAVVDYDNFTTPIFWVPANKRNENYYGDTHLPLKGFLPLPDPNPNKP
ncbi:MAG: SusD/RagB family nutrient-binding outer membrane lipoprotein [Tannerella sp.]|jgi:hypothetical protein|nr:SusD/RagB family nutrient-binding outer membrane lipoprotein [Tannerella sp.]